MRTYGVDSHAGENPYEPDSALVYCDLSGTGCRARLSTSEKGTKRVVEM